MSLLNRLLAPRQNGRLTTVAKEVAARSCAAVWSHVQHGSLSMSAAEARGYLRAHASPVVRQEAELALKRHLDLDPALRPQLIEAAKDRLVASLLDEVLRVQKLSRGQRRAA